MLYNNKNRVKKFQNSGLFGQFSQANYQTQTPDFMKPQYPQQNIGDANGLNTQNIMAADQMNKFGQSKQQFQFGNNLAKQANQFGNTSQVFKPMQPAYKPADVSTGITPKTGEELYRTQNNSSFSDTIAKNAQSAAGSSAANTVTNLAVTGVNAGIDAGVRALGDDKDYTYTKKEAAGDIAGSALKTASTVALGTMGTAAATALSTGASMAAAGAAAGSAFPIVGTIIGAVVGAGLGYLKYRKNKKKAAQNNTRRIRNIGLKANAAAEKEIMAREKQLMSTPQLATTSPNSPQAGVYNNVSKTYGYRAGGILRSDIYRIKELAQKKRSFRTGGQLASNVNIIPNGVLHEEHNKLGDKGMPVVKCDFEKKKCDKKYEIEKDEMILTFDTTKKVEELAKGKKFKDLGQFLVEEILNNTHSFTDKYKHLNKLN